jgi:hypothetical protein
MTSNDINKFKVFLIFKLNDSKSKIVLFFLDNKKYHKQKFLQMKTSSIKMFDLIFLEI